ncbi:MAG: HDIG domain-containing protein [Phycisphaerales bacterium]|nr:HDIG domain-containing protein [Phycisphaerales bacterium]
MLGADCCCPNSDMEGRIGGFRQGGMLRTITNNFAALTVAGVALAWVLPAGFTWMTDGSIRVAGQPLLSLALGAIMLAMGLTLTFDDYRALARMPRALLAGVGLQFAVMPLAGFLIARVLALEPGLAVGLILVACCPGGTASNIVAYIARGHVALSVAILAGGMVAYLFAFCRNVVDRPRRMLWLAAAIVATTGLACVGAVFNAEYTTLLASAPTVFLAASLVIAFDRRVAMAIASIQAVLIAVALQQGPWLVIISITGAASAVWWLNNVRSRNVALWAALWTGLGMGVAGLAGGLVSKPMAPGVWNDILLDASQAAIGGLVVGFVVLLLPLIEAAFDVVTPMRLIELRDPKQPLLREMAQRAPGSYTHSISVASIAEAAADAIGANGLHVYAGALYHDIGKMNKPEYFVENQAGGINPHEKLSPAMSLLVIVGHVKEGMEMARESNLPRSIRHYIESHHGTTLVEYFFERARRQAGEADESEPFEFGYRYPGPKPQTREAAILMLADAVEGAARTLAEPTPSRIESLVHAIAAKRLTDGQFDECDLTLRELHEIEKSIVKSLNSIYHARIAYPGQSEGAKRRPAAPTMANRGVTA